MESAERWRRVEELFYAVLEQEPQAAAGFLQQACGGDTELLREVQSLLDSSKHSLGFARSAVLHVARQQSAGIQSPGKRIGDYLVQKELGEGGMGTVYLATRSDDQQRVAIKLIQPWVGLSRSMLQRFNTEREILGNLDHPNIARLLDAGVTDDEVPYLIMEYVDGLPIDDYCCHNRLSTSHRLRLFLVVCAAVEHAHQNLIVHRDIKPANILVTAEGVPKLLDFGIAKLLDPTAKDHNATRLSQRMMTLEYASPEQVCGGKITAATDVYALGVLLYELLAGHHPFQLRGKSPLEIGQIISEQRAEPPSQTIAADAGRHPADAARTLRGDLDHIVLMAMRKRPSRRYPSVAALSRDLTAYLTGYPLPTRTYSRTQRVSKYVARHKVGVLAALLMILALVGLVVVVAMRTGRESQERGLPHTFAAHGSFQVAAGFALTDL